MKDRHGRREKLLILLPHWIEHNSEHAEEFRAGAGDAGSASWYLEQAAQRLEQANRFLASALKEMREADRSA